MILCPIWPRSYRSLLLQFIALYSSIIIVWNHSTLFLHSQTIEIENVQSVRYIVGQHRLSGPLCTSLHHTFGGNNEHIADLLVEVGLTVDQL